MPNGAHVLLIFFQLFKYLIHNLWRLLTALHTLSATYMNGESWELSVNPECRVLSNCDEFGARCHITIGAAFNLSTGPNDQFLTVLPHRNATTQAQNMKSHPVTLYRHGADLLCCFLLMMWTQSQTSQLPVFKSHQFRPTDRPFTCYCSEHDTKSFCFAMRIRVASHCH